jgi:hypothetical protein
MKSCIYCGSVMDGSRERHKPLGEFVDRAGTAQHGQLVEWGVSERWSEPGVDQLDKLRPGWPATVELHPVELEMGVVQEVAGCE